MLDSIEFENFKGIRHLQIAGLRQVNVIVGGNNVGKTSVLEGLYLVASPPQPPTAVSSLRYVAEEGFDEWIGWASNLEAGVAGFSITCRDGDAGRMVSAHRGEEIRYTESQQRMLGRLIPPNTYGSRQEKNWFKLRDGWFLALSYLVDVEQLRPRIVPSSVSSRMEVLQDYESAIVFSQFESDIEGVLRKLDPRIRTLRVAKPQGRNRGIYVDCGGEIRLPLEHFGAGASRLLSIVTQAYMAGGGVLLIDEIESGIHHQFMASFWSVLLELAERTGIQIFATTHSYECLKAAAEAAAKIPGDQLALHRLYRKNGEIACITGDEQRLLDAIDSGFEVR